MSHRIQVSARNERTDDDLLFFLNRIGSWKLNPYLSFSLSAVVELLAYILVHLILDRVGRKKPYCLFAVLFGIVAISVVPIQVFLKDDSFSKRADRLSVSLGRFSVSFSENCFDEYHQWRSEILRLGIICDHLHICK